MFTWSAGKESNTCLYRAVIMLISFAYKFKLRGLTCADQDFSNCSNISISAGVASATVWLIASVHDSNRSHR